MQKTTNPHITPAVSSVTTDGLMYHYVAINASGIVHVSYPLTLVTEDDASKIVRTIIALLEEELHARE